MPAPASPIFSLHSLMYAALFALTLTLSGCALFERSKPAIEAAAVPKARLSVVSKPAPTPQPSSVELSSARFDDLPNWQGDRAARALMAFRNSCNSLTRTPSSHPIGKTTLGGQARDWHSVCKAARQIDGTNDAAARAFFESNFEPFLVGGRGVFTGYFEAVLEGALMPSAAFPVPIYQAPDQAKAWMKDPKTGPARADLEGGTVPGLKLEPLLYLADYTDAFTLHVQGSGLIRLRDGSQIRVGYAANNGHPFGSILSAMKAEGFDEGKGKTWQAMTGWLKKNPSVAQQVLATNKRFIFFEKADPRAATGAQGQPLTAGRSLAVDPSHIPLGVPMFIDTQMIYRGKVVPLQRLMVAQDTGGAIKGPVRGDVYWGTGAGALELAGKMKEPGRYFILLPKS